MKHHKVITVLFIMSLVLLHSCDLYDAGKKDFRLALPQPSENIYTIDSDKARGQDGVSEANPLPKGLTVHPLANITVDDGTVTLAQTDDGRRLCVHGYTVSPIMCPPVRETINYSYRHYDKTPLSQLKGSPISVAIDRWGDYTFRTPGPMDYGDGIFPASPADTATYGHTYTYPQIMLLEDGRYLKGVRLHTTPEGIIRDVEPLRGIQRNLFGSLPFYEDILSMNIMEWLMPGLWLEEGEEPPSRGVFFSIVYALMMYLAVTLALMAVLTAIYLPIDRKIPKIRGYVGTVAGIAVLLVEYIVIITILDYYSAGWWVSAILLFGMSGIPFIIVLVCSRDYCPECHGHEWFESTMISGVEMPVPKFVVRWNGKTPVINPEKESLIKIQHTTYKTCKSCCHVKSYTNTEEVLRERNICPKCYRNTLSGEYTSFELLPGNVVKAEYEESCSSAKCGYRIVYTLNKSYGTAPAAPAVRPARRPQDNAEKPEPRKNGCWHCPNRNWGVIAPSNAMCTKGFGGPVPCEYTYDQSQCPYYISE